MEVLRAATTRRQVAQCAATLNLPCLKAITVRKVLIAISTVLLAGCSLVYARLTYDFVVLPENRQIFYEAGAQDLAKLAADELDVSIDKVEKLQFAPFKNREAIRVYVFNDRNHYAN